MEKEVSVVGSRLQKYLSLFDHRSHSGVQIGIKAISIRFVHQSWFKKIPCSFRW